MTFIRFSDMLSELRTRFFREIESRPEDGWSSSGIKEGIEVFQKKVEGAALNMVLGRGIANVPVRAVWDIISQVQRKAEWDKLFKSGNLLESLDADTGMMMEHATIASRRNHLCRDPLQRIQRRVADRPARLCAYTGAALSV